jgi:O-glycosyl hydrolase
MNKLAILFCLVFWALNSCKAIHKNSFKKTKFPTTPFPSFSPPTTLPTRIPTFQPNIKNYIATIIVDASIRYQVMEGFGASNAFNTLPGGALTPNQISLLFDPINGIGLSLLRTMIPVSL